MDWNRRAVGIATLVTEIAWVSIAASLLSVYVGVGKSAVTFPFALAIALAAFLETRYISRARVPEIASRVLGGALAAATIYLVMGFQSGAGLTVFRAGWVMELITANSPVLRQLTVGTALLIAFWASGARHGLASSPGQGLAVTFRIGIPVVLLGTIANTFISPPLDTTLAVYAFFGAGLTGLALTQMASLDFGASAIRGTWGRLLLLTLGITVGGSLLLAVLTSTGIGTVVAFGVGLVAGAIRFLLLGLAFVLGYLTEIVVNLIAPLISDNVNETLTRMAETLEELGNFEERDTGEGGADWVPTALRWVMLSLTALAAGFLLIVLFRRRRGLENGGPDSEERESLSEHGTVMGDVAAALGSLLQGIAGRGRRGVRAAFQLEGPIGVTYRMYFYLLVLARRRGLRRATSETPLEFQARVVEQFPAEETALLTSAFTRARYGGHVPSRDELAGLRDAWETIRAATPGSSSIGGEDDGGDFDLHDEAMRAESPAPVDTPDHPDGSTANPEDQ